MATTYYYYTGPLFDIATRVAALNGKILVDLDLPVANYVSTSYNVGTGNVEVVFNVSLNEYLLNILNNLAAIALYDKQVNVDVYVFDADRQNRRSIGVATAPSVNNDDKSGYDVGSLVWTTGNELYICEDNTTGNAVWDKIFPVTHPYALISDTTNQFVPLVTSSVVITFDTNEMLNEISHTANTSQITLQKAGVYRIEVTAQLNGAAADLSVWVRKNGIDLPRSNHRATLVNVLEYVTLSFSLLDAGVIGDYYEFVQASTDVSAGLVSVGSQVTPTIPVTPSIVVSINKISS
jgi:hypothetical protein